MGEPSQGVPDRVRLVRGRGGDGEVPRGGDHHVHPDHPDCHPHLRRGRHQHQPRPGRCAQAPCSQRREAEAEAEAEAEPEAEAEAEAHYGAVIAPVAVVAPVAPVVTTHEPVKSAGYPVCNSVPEKTCERIPTSTPRKVARTVCDTVVDVTTIEDCTETVTKHCQHTSSSSSSSSKVVGSHSKVVTNALHAVAHPAVPTNVIG